MTSFREVDVAQQDGYRPLSLDLRTPDIEGAPLVVFLHGGGFLRGSRKVFTPGIADADSFDRIVAAGLAVASCEYRLSGEACFPAQLDDVDAALAWLQEHSGAYGVDASRIVLWGVSAGATIAALAGLRRDDIAGVVDWFGPADLFTMAEYDTRETAEATREARWLGGPAMQNPDLARAASPALQVHPQAPPFHIAHGTADTHVPIAQSEELLSALDAHGVPAHLHRVQGGQHFWQGVADTAPLFDSAIDFTRRVTRLDTKDTDV
ncbi:alpha/beta hydrolase fold domain-containing protein [Microbacterium sp.]|uniref:alpha/beta hydrolase fold domain-containing protein n=1 Tax=Microbacterium sp. TaxID=51671 RepID=UPI003A909D26